MGQFHVDIVVVKRGIRFFHQNQVPLFHSGSCRGASDPSVLVLSLKSSLLMTMLQVVADILHLAKGFAFISK